MKKGLQSNQIIDIKQVSFSYEDKNVLDDVSLCIEEGTYLGLVGPNGSGKSTLIKLILGIIKPTQGTISLFGTPIEQFKEWNKIGFVSQKANSFNTGFPATVLEVVLSGLVSKLGLFHFYTKIHKKKAYDMLEAVGMDSYWNRNIGELSGGQQQRVFIARALVSEPELLILDEPTVGVDIKNVESFYTMLAHLNREQKMTLLMVTHDIGTITHHATHVACLNKTLHFHGNSHDFEHIDHHDLSLFYGHDLHVLEHQHDPIHHGGTVQ